MRVSARIEITSVSVVWLDIIFGLLVMCTGIIICVQNSVHASWITVVALSAAGMSYFAYRSVIQGISSIVFGAADSYLVLRHNKIKVDAFALDFLSSGCVVFTLRLEESIRIWRLSIDRLPICLFRIKPSWPVCKTNTDFHSVFVACKTGHINKLVNR